LSEGPVLANGKPPNGENLSDEYKHTELPICAGDVVRTQAKALQEVHDNVQAAVLVGEMASNPGQAAAPQQHIAPLTNERSLSAQSLVKSDIQIKVSWSSQTQVAHGDHQDGQHHGGTLSTSANRGTQEENLDHRQPPSISTVGNVKASTMSVQETLSDLPVFDQMTL